MEETNAIVTAAENGDVPALTTLLEICANEDTTDFRERQRSLVSFNRTLSDALSCAARKGHVECVDLIVRYFSDDSAWDKYHPCHFADPGPHHPFITAALRGNADVVQVLIQARAPLDKAIYKMLDFAVFDKEMAQAVMFLLDEGVSISDRDSLSYLTKASQSGKADLVEKLIKAGASIDAKDANTGNTALINACRMGSLSVARCLLKNNAAVNVTNNKAETALLHAVQCIKHVHICDALLSAGAVVENELHAATSRGYYHIVKMMFNVGATPQMCKMKVPIVPLYMTEVLKEVLISNIELSPLFTAFLFKKAQFLVMKFVHCNFLHYTDLKPPSHMMTAVVNQLTRLNNRNSLALLTSLYRQPWSLQTLCHVTISTCVGSSGSDRLDRLKKTGLPVPLQQKLMFKTPDLDDIDLSPATLKQWWAENYGSTDVNFDEEDKDDLNVDDSLLMV